MLYQIENLVLNRKRANDYQLLIRRLQIAKGARLAFTGPSGCGKSTTLDLLGLSLAPANASQFLFAPDESCPVSITDLWENNETDKLATLRAGYFGYVLQSGELLPFLQTGENMLLTAKMAGIDQTEAEATAHDLATRMDIDHLWYAMPQTLSVGERQRAAIVRSLTAKPQIIIADEPTAALDPLHAEKVMEAFLQCLDNYQSALILATHNTSWAKNGGLIELPIQLEQTANGVTAIVEYAPGEHL